jgi:hypothetical protein
MYYTLALFSWSWWAWESPLNCRIDNAQYVPIDQWEPIFYDTLYHTRAIYSAKRILRGIISVWLLILWLAYDIFVGSPANNKIKHSVVAEYMLGRSETIGQIFRSNGSFLPKEIGDMSKPGDQYWNRNRRSKEDELWNYEMIAGVLGCETPSFAQDIKYNIIAQ